jgi:hypothetical protein
VIATLVPGLEVDCIEGNEGIDGEMESALQEREGKTKALQENSVPLTKVKLHLLGDSGVGKTRLKRSLTRYFNIFR